MAIEFFREDAIYDWDVVEPDGSVEKVTLVASESDGRRHLYPAMMRALCELDPDVVIVPGWAGAGALTMLAWACRRGRAAVVMSESNAHDVPRGRLTELVKSGVVRLFSAALVGGVSHREYLVGLGMPEERVFLGYDVVDNQHFMRCEGDRGDPSLLARVEVGRVPFFIACARFVPKKNLKSLIEAYALYRSGTSGTPWDLVILGDGPLRACLESRRAELGLAGSMFLPGFKQYQELPGWYQAAGAFVHASTSEQWGLVVNEAMAAGLPVLVSRQCGCANDLVHDGVNGFKFDAQDVPGLAKLMITVASNGFDRAAAGCAGKRIISDWGPERFAQGLRAAVASALAAPRRSNNLLDRLLVDTVARFR